MEQQAKAPQDLRNVVNYLRSSKSGMKVRVGVYNGKRIDYFKGKSALKALQSPAYTKLKNVPPVTSDADAQSLLTSLLPFAFFLRVERQPAPANVNAPRPVLLTQQQVFTPDDYFAWFYEGSQWTTYIGGIAMVAIMLAGVMFPLWPPIMRLGVWYLSVAVLALVGLFFALAIVRLIFYIITVIVASPGIWIFPKLFADVGFVESFIPLWEWDLPKKKTKKKRVEKSEKGKAKDSASPENGQSPSPSLAPADDSGSAASSRPASRAARVEDAPDDES
ncbi:translocation protein [Obba rivulosa]|uniref:Translocation protein SEC62 n=1 Tax=Obba rivulosa TaxID=1052685 RepID=A0A8E2AZA3_9APHY|nr:translocation protein [Obba rivulosa]